MDAAIVRVYKRDREDALQFVGENAIDHTPKDEKEGVMVRVAEPIPGEWKILDATHPLLTAAAHSRPPGCR